MNAMLDNSLVGLMLVASIFYALAKLSPQNARRRVLRALAAQLARAPRGLRLATLAERAERAADDKAQGACGGCDNCGSEVSPPSVGGEIRVPIANITRTRSPRQE